MAGPPARLRALPDALLPLLGLGVFTPILGPVMIPLLSRIISQVSAITIPTIP